MRSTRIMINTSAGAAAAPSCSLPRLNTSLQRCSSRAALIVQRKTVHEPMQTGLKAVDNLIPISRGTQILRGNGRNSMLSSPKRQFQQYETGRSKYPSLTIKSQQTYTSQITIVTDIPLFESPHASFDRYMEDKPRVFKAIFPESRGTQRLNEEEWRIRMEPIAFLFLTAWPVVNMTMRCKTNGTEYPSGVPIHTSMVLELELTKWELEGVTNQVMKASDFRLGMEGTLYPDRREARSRIRGHLKMSLSFTPPPVLSLVPAHVHQDVTQSVMKSLAEGMKHKVSNNLLADYTKFKKEKHKSPIPP